MACKSDCLTFSVERVLISIHFFLDREHLVLGDQEPLRKRVIALWVGLGAIICFIAIWRFLNGPSPSASSQGLNFDFRFATIAVALLGCMPFAHNYVMQS